LHHAAEALFMGEGKHVAEALFLQLFYRATGLITKVGEGLFHSGTIL